MRVYAEPGLLTIPSVRVRLPWTVQLEPRVNVPVDVLFNVTLPSKATPHVNVLASVVPSNVTVLPLRLNVPFWVKECSIVMAVPAYVIVAPELLIRLTSLMSHPSPLWVIVPALVRMLEVIVPTPFIVQVPEVIIIVPLFVKVARPKLQSGLAPNDILQPELRVVVPPAPEFVLLSRTVPPSVLEQVMVEDSKSKPSKVTVFPVFVNVPPETVKLCSTVKESDVPVLVNVPPVWLKFPSFMSMTVLALPASVKVPSAIASASPDVPGSIVSVVVAFCVMIPIYPLLV